MKKANTITKIVRLQQVVKRWKIKSHNNNAPPPGSIAVYVGPDRQRFVIQTRFLNLPVFAALLHDAEEEFGFQTDGGLVLPCEPGLFRGILRFLEKDEERFSRLGLNEFLKMVRDMGYDDQVFTCKEPSCHGFTPLLQKTPV